MQERKGGGGAWVVVLMATLNRGLRDQRCAKTVGRRILARARQERERRLTISGYTPLVTRERERERSL